MTLEEMRDSITTVVNEAGAQFADTNPARLEQLESVAASALMAIDALFTEVPYRY